MSRYWEEVRSALRPVRDRACRPPSAEVYAYEMPGGQYTNLFQQAKALGLASRWPEVCKAYAEVNLLFGDIVKVTPTSKVVGDMALFLVANNLTPDDTLDPERELAFPESVVELFEGRLGQPPGGFPPALQERVLKGRPAAHRAARQEPAARPTSPPPARRPTALLGRPATDRDALSLLLYPRVFPDLAAHERTYSDTSILPTPIFFYGPDPAVENLVEIEPGKTLIVKLAGRRRAARRRQADRLLRAERPAARGRGRRPLARLGRPRDPQGRPDRPQPDRRARCPAWSSASRSTPATRSARARSSSRSRR